MHILLLSRNQRFATPDGHQVMPFAMHRRELLERHDTRVTNTPASTTEDRTNALRSAFDGPDAPDTVLVMPRWSEPAHELEDWFRHARTITGDARLVMLDYYAPTSSPHFGVLPLVDRYIKRQTLRDRALYQNDYRGGFIYADFVSRRWDFDLEEWNFGSKPDPAHLHKLVTGWNLGITPRYRRMLTVSSALPLPWKARPIDLHLRVGAINRTDKAQEWYQVSRAKALESVQPLAARHRLSGSGRVGSRRYFAELFASKIVFSPFGWGEVCFRDYEAVAAGALLVKPDMAHLETAPDIYVPHETYVPLPWDFAEASETIAHYLAHPEESRRIIANARGVLKTYYDRGGFARTLADCLRPEPVPEAPP